MTVNRMDLIQATARDIASNIHSDPAAINALADQLIELIGQMINGVGKMVYSQGERDMNEAHGWIKPGGEDRAAFEREQRRAIQQAGTMMSTGGEIESAARSLADDCKNPEVDLDRWTRPDPGAWCLCGHSPKSHRSGVCIGEDHNRRACYEGARRCTVFEPKPPSGGWTYQDRRPEALKTRDTVEPSAGCTCDPGPEGRHRSYCGTEPPYLPAVCTCTPNRILDLAARKVTYQHTAVCTVTVMVQQADKAIRELNAELCCYPTGSTCALCRAGQKRVLFRFCCYPLGDVCPTHC